MTLFMLPALSKGREFFWSPLAGAFDQREPPKAENNFDGRMGCHVGRRLRARKYGRHFTGVTVSGVPLPELTQPTAVSLLAFTRR